MSSEDHSLKIGGVGAQYIAPLQTHRRGMIHHAPTVICALFIVSVIFQLVALPPLQGSDEPLHAAYAFALYNSGQLPERTTYLDNCTRQQSGQPPLIYGLGAVALTVARVPHIPCQAVFDYAYGARFNRWLLTPDPLRRDDNRTNFLPLSTIPPPEGLLRGLIALRGVSAAFGLLAVIGAGLAAREIFPRSRERQTLTLMLFAATPTFVHLSAYYTNDTPAIALATLVTWRALTIAHRGITWRRALETGALLGIGGLAKVSVLLVAPAVGVALIVVLMRAPRRDYIPNISQMALGITLPLALTFGLWALWGWQTYRDPFGTATHIHPTLNYDPLLGFDAVWRGLPNIAQTYFGLLGYANIYLRPVSYWAAVLIVIMACVGWIIKSPQRTKTGFRFPLSTWGEGVRGRGIILLVLFIVTFAGFTQWYRTFFSVTGRLLLPAGIALAAFVAGGMVSFGRAINGRAVARPYAVVVVMGVFAVTGWIVPLVALHEAYSPALLDAFPPLRGSIYDFDATVRFVGYSDLSPTHITACWQVLAPTDRLAAYTVRYVKDGVSVGERTTIHGLGRYNSTLWQAGAKFCDALDIPLGDAVFGATPPISGTTYDVLVFLLDAQSLAVNWQASAPDGTPIPFAVVGQVTIP